jgi:hypothetical protein
VLLFDLGSQEGVELLARGDLEAILREQELQLSELASDPQAASRVGKILGAEVGLVEVQLEADSGDLDYQIWRTDIQQNIFR